MIKYEENTLRIEDIQKIRKAVRWSMFTENHLQNNERCSIQLIAAKGKEAFYESLGFARIPNDLSGHGMQMFIKKK